MNSEENLIKKIIGETPEEQYENSEEEFSLDKVVSKMSEEDKLDRNKKGSSINEIIGRNTNKKDEIKKIFEKLFSGYQDGWKKFMEGKELKKSKEQMRLIEYVNGETNKLLEKYEVEKFNVNSNNVHLLGKEDMANFFERKAEKIDVPIGVYYWYLQAALLNQKEGYDKLSFSHIMFHELTHFKEFQKLYAKNDNGLGLNDTKGDEENLLIKISEDKDFFKKYNLIQHGISLIIASDANKFKEYMFEGRKDIPNAKDFRRLLLKEKMDKVAEICFYRLNEAIVEELAIRFQKDILENNPEFEEQKKMIEEYVKQEKEKGIEIDEDEVFYLKKKIRYSSDSRKEYKTIEAERARYELGREILNSLVDKLYNGNQDKFKNREEVFDLFVKSLFTGNIVGKDSWGKLIEETFGEGTLRKLMEKDSSLTRSKDLREFVEGLKEKRQRQSMR